MYEKMVHDLCMRDALQPTHERWCGAHVYRYSMTCAREMLCNLHMRDGVGPMYKDIV